MHYLNDVNLRKKNKAREAKKWWMTWNTESLKYVTVKKQ